MRYEDPFDPKMLLPARIRETPAWADFCDAMQKVFAENIIDGKEYLLRSRDSLKFRRGQFFRFKNRLYRIEHVIHNNTSYPFDPIPETLVVSDGEGVLYELSGINATNERYMLVRNAAELGFNVIVERLNDEDFSRLCDSLGAYHHQNGTKAFIDYIGFIKNINLKITQLWAEEDGENENYVNMQPYPLGTTVIEDPENGTWYPTSHYRVEYDGIVFPDFQDSDFFELFLKFAPIHIVLESFSAVFALTQANLYIHGYNFYDNEMFHISGNDPLAPYVGTLYSNVTLAMDSEIFHLPANS